MCCPRHCAGTRAGPRRCWAGGRPPPAGPQPTLPPPLPPHPSGSRAPSARRGPGWGCLCAGGASGCLGGSCLGAWAQAQAGGPEAVHQGPRCTRLPRATARRRRLTPGRQRQRRPWHIHPRPGCRRHRRPCRRQRGCPQTRRQCKGGRVPTPGAGVLGPGCGGGTVGGCGRPAGPVPGGLPLSRPSLLPTNGPRPSIALPPSHATPLPFSTPFSFTHHSSRSLSCVGSALVPHPPPPASPSMHSNREGGWGGVVLRAAGPGWGRVRAHGATTRASVSPGAPCSPYQPTDRPVP
jgi:hypothetical protein